MTTTITTAQQLLDAYNKGERDFSYANLSDANLSFANLPSASHDAVAEVLKRAAEEEREERSVRHLMVAGLVLLKRDWCWRSFAGALREFPEDRAWAASVLQTWPCFADQVKAYEKER